ncbi:MULTISPECIES: hypothetical protein [unclassified Nocardioides]|uniref:hypothetical protein n=1 Tax=unclassified Nocardioides TaxID=2615069 RepID=UPI0006F30040|nr:MULTISPECIES: hypothetical protein [unclassified Nocardioides]KRA38792.1 hypothetical protein ASD81_09385 [Nocardioides sp. Root614]KRA92752.1 hypothetical protein ASD84_09650 [Nocardioides sp. Root682]
MPTIDLTRIPSREPAPPAPVLLRNALDAAPRRLGVTLPELQHAAHLAGDAPLPFDVAPPAAADAMQSRLGQSPATTEDQSYRSVVEALHQPAESLARRGLVVDGVLDPGVAGAIGLLAAPRIALDADLRIGEVQAKVWHRQDGPAVASLSTVDGIVFELGWFGTDAWAAELARVAAPSEEVALTTSALPSYVDLPLELADAAAEAVRVGRGDLVPVLTSRHSGATRGADGALPDDVVSRLLVALSGEAQGRLRALVADVSGEEVDTVGVVSWTLLADGWRALRPHHEDGVLRLEIRAVEPADLAGVIAPVMAPLVANTSGEDR